VGTPRADDARPERREGHSVHDAIVHQRSSCEQLGSPFYAALLDLLAEDHAAGGPTALLLDDRSERPLHDALPLRLLGALHGIVLDGDEPALARHYPSAGGDGSHPSPDAIRQALERHHDRIDTRLDMPVQTNEVARSGALAVGYAAIGRRWGLPLRLFELGASAGLNLHPDAYAYVDEAPDWNTGGSRPSTRCIGGDPTSPVRVNGPWNPVPDLTAIPRVIERAGCDVEPIDPSDDTARRRLLSFVWPDHAHRRERLIAALDIASRRPERVERADAGDWIDRRLRHLDPGTATVVMHSIVWQYLPNETRDRVRSAIGAAAARATPSAPLAWLRMEPAGPHADVRLTTWPGGDETVVAHAGYHGADVRPTIPDRA
jgi:hypothetical protein